MSPARIIPDYVILPSKLNYHPGTGGTTPLRGKKKRYLVNPCARKKQDIFIPASAGNLLYGGEKKVFSVAGRKFFVFYAGKEKKVEQLND